jgi:hypothetical protein
LIDLVSLLRRNVRKAESFQLIVAGLEIMPIDYSVHRQRMMRARVSKRNTAGQSPHEEQAEHPAGGFHGEVRRHAMCGSIGVAVHYWYLVQLSVSLFDPWCTDRPVPNLFAKLSEKLCGASAYRLEAMRCFCKARVRNGDPQSLALLPASSCLDARPCRHAHAQDIGNIGVNDQR